MPKSSPTSLCDFIYSDSRPCPRMNMGDLDDFGELYADLEDRVIAGVLVSEAEEEDKNETEEKGAGCENGTMENGSSSDSEDDLQIVLNEEDYPSKLSAQLLAEGRDCEEEEGDDMVIVTGSDCSGKEPTWAEQVQSVDGLLQGNGDRGNATKGAHRNWSRNSLAGSAVRAWKSLSGRGHWDHLTVPCSLGKASYNLGFPMAFSNGYDFYLPRNRTIFNINVESFECKPWRFNGVDITDYFNFGLDEEGWRTYCNQLVHFQQNKFPLYESSKLSKPTGIMSGEVAQYGRDNGPEIPDYVDNGRKGIFKPKGRAIQVESGNGDRIPSVDVRRPRNRDSDVVIQITTGFGVEDASDSIINKITHVDDNGSKSVNSKNEFCKSFLCSSFSVGTCAHKCEGSCNSSDCPHPYTKKPFDEKLDNMNCGRDCPSRDISLSKSDAIIADHYSNSPKSSYHNGSFEASRDEVCLEKVPSPECIHLNSDSLLQESVLSHCYPSSETGSDSSKTDRTTCGGHSPESLLDLNYCQQRTPRKVVELNLSSDDRVASSLVHRQNFEGEHQTKESGTIVRQWDDEPDVRGLSTHGDKISLKNNIKDNNGKKVQAASFLACSKDHDEDPSPVRNREKRTAAREVKTRRNGCYINQKAQLNSRAHYIVNRDCLQSSPRNMSLYDKRGCRTSRTVDEHDMIMEAHYNAMEAKERHRERSLDEYRERSSDKHFGRCVPYFDKEEESFIDKYDRVSCSAGALRRLQELDSYGKTLLVNLERSNRYAYNHEDSRLYEGGLHPRICREAYDEGKRGLREDGSHRNQVTTLFEPDKRYLSHSGHSHTRETFSQLRSKHGIFSSKKCHPFSRIGFNFDDDQFPAEVRIACPDNSAYNERRKNSPALPGLLAKEEASIRHQDSNNLSSPARYTFYGTVQHQNGRVDKSSFSGQKIYGNHCHNSSGNKLTVRSGKDCDTRGRVGSLSDNFVKDRHELDDRGCREAVSEHLNGWKVKTKGRCTSIGGRSHLGSDIAASKEPRDPNDNEGYLHHNMKMTNNHFYPASAKEGYSNHSMTKSSNKHPITEEEIEELEEGQLVEESDNHETAEIKCNSDGRTPALTANAVSSLNHLSNPKMDLTDPIQKNKLVGRYDRNYLLETLVKMEKRRERFKDPIPLKKEPENCGNMQPDAPIEDGVKQQRPARKRRWGSS